MRKGISGQMLWILVTTILVALFGVAIFIFVSNMGSGLGI